MWLEPVSVWLEFERLQVLRGCAPRSYGEELRDTGNYERIAPSPEWDHINRLFKKNAKK